VDYKKGLKFDINKPMWNLLPLEPIYWVVKIMTYGAKKYAPNNWKKVNKERYEAAMWRHWYAYKQGEIIDKESKMPHLAHFLTNCFFYFWKVLHNNKETIYET